MAAKQGQRLLVMQSLWAMERRHTDGVERTLEENVEMIAAPALTALARIGPTGPRSRGSPGC